jgi:hypothetical protein
MKIDDVTVGSTWTARGGAVVTVLAIVELRGRRMLRLRSEKTGRELPKLRSAAWLREAVGPVAAGEGALA